MLVVVAIAFGGAAGALARYGLDRLIEHRLITVFPWSTFAINVSGCLLAGIAVAAPADRADAPGWVRTGLVVGFLGAYTTFSTFSQEARDLLVGGHAGTGIAYALVSTAVGVAAVGAGLSLGRAL